MLKYIMLLLAVVAVVGGSSLESLASGGPMVEYMMAFVVALMLKPWIQSQFE